MTREEIQAVQPEEILSPFHRSLLSQHAVKLFVELWYHSAFKNMNVSVMDNKQAAGRIRIPYERLQAAQEELINRGLMKIDRLNGCARYEFIPLADSDSETDEEIWQQYADAL